MDDGETPQSAHLIQLSAEIVAAYVSHNSLSPPDLPRLIGEVHSALKALVTGKPLVSVSAAAPAVPVNRSITPEYLICLEDGKRFKSLRRHLKTYHGLTPEQYRERWGLPRDYPMVAPKYSAIRSSLAKGSGLGRRTPSKRGADG